MSTMRAVKAAKAAKVAMAKATKAAKSKPRLPNKDKVGEKEYHPEPTLWSRNHGRENADINAIVSAFRYSGSRQKKGHA